MVQTQKKAIVDPLTYIYYQTKDNIGETTNEDILATDLTDHFWTTIRQRIQNNNLVTIAIRGEVTSGKSTLALAIKSEVNQIIQKLGKNKNINEYETICSDQIEFNRAIMKGQTNICFIIDEWSELANSGENATTEQNLFQFYTDVCAQRFIHRIMCTPRIRTNYDYTSTIILDVLGRDDNKKTTLCRIYRNDPTDTILTPLGTINVHVGDILKKEWYSKYRQKKFARISLLDKHGVKDIRELEASTITLQTYKELKELAGTTEKIPNEIITITVRKILQERKLFYSIVGKTSIENPIRALLGTTYSINKLRRKLAETPMQQARAVSIQRMADIMQQKLDEMIQQEEKNSKTLEQYYNIQ